MRPLAATCMSLEEEAERQRAGPPPRERATVRMPTPVDRLFRIVALLILAVGAFATLYVPVVLLPPWGLLVVLALTILGLIAVAGRLHELRVRVDGLEQRLDGLSDAGVEEPPEREPPQEE